MITVILYGHLAKKFGKRHEMEISTPAEAIRALCANFKDFKAEVIQDGQALYNLFAGSEDRADVDAMHLPVGNFKTVKIIPIISGRGGLGKVLLGAALIGASFFLPVTPLISGFSFSLSSIASGIGFSLLLGGISSMLFSPPKPKTSSTERPSNLPSYAFNGAVNTIGQGNPVPYFFGGPLLVGSQVISAGLTTENI